VLAAVFAIAALSGGARVDAAVCGDANGSGALTTGDVTLLRRFVVGLPPPPGGL
jgi:hypothetical protein